MSRDDKRITIRDVARRAGVSFKTVSRVINAVPTVDADMRERVKQAIDELGYRPHRAAKLLGGGKSSTLALMIGEGHASQADKPRRMPSFIVDVMTGALSACREGNYTLLVLEISADKDAGLADLDRAFHDHPLDGVILAPPRCDYPWLLDYLEEQAIPVARILPGFALERGGGEGARPRG